MAAKSLLKKFMWGNLILLLAGVCMSMAEAATISLGFGTLPSAQGWTYVKSTTGSHADDVETDVFSVSGGVLTGNTLGSGTASPSGLGYILEDVVNTNAWELAWTMRVLDYEFETTFPWGIRFDVYSGTSLVSLGLSTTHLGVVDGASNSTIAHANTSFQDFRLEYTPGGATGSWELFVNNGSLLSGAARSTTFNQLVFGDGTGARNGKWEMTAYSFTQTVPLPPAIYLFGSGLIGLIGIAKKRNAA